MFTSLNPVWLLKILINEDHRSPKRFNGEILLMSYSSVNVIYFCGVLQTLEPSLGSLLQLLRTSAEVFHLLAPPLRLQHLPQLHLPLSHGIQVTMETTTLPQQRLSPQEYKLQVK